MQHPPVHEPLNLEAYPGVNEGVEISAGVFQRQGVGVYELLADEDVYFCGKVHELGPRWCGC